MAKDLFLVTTSPSRDWESNPNSPSLVARTVFFPVRINQNFKEKHFFVKSRKFVFEKGYRDQ